MSARTSPGDAAALDARRMVAALCAELRGARIGAGLSLGDAAPGCRASRPRSSDDSSEGCSASRPSSSSGQGKRRHLACACPPQSCTRRAPPIRDRRPARAARTVRGSAWHTTPIPARGTASHRSRHAGMGRRWSSARRAGHSSSRARPTSPMCRPLSVACGSKPPRRRPEPRPVILLADAKQPSTGSCFASIERPCATCCRSTGRRSSGRSGRVSAASGERDPPRCCSRRESRRPALGPAGEDLRSGSGAFAWPVRRSGDQRVQWRRRL